MSQKVQRLKSADVVPDDASPQLRNFAEHRWSNVQKLAKLHQRVADGRDDKRAAAVKKRRLISSLFGHEVELIVSGKVGAIEDADGAAIITPATSTRKSGKKRTRGQ